MNKIKDIKDKLICEISQKHELEKNLAFQILTSKRLLNEHLENFEEVTNTLLNGKTTISFNYLTLLSTTTSLLSCYGLYNCLSSNARFVIPCIAGMVPLAYIHKTINLKQRISLETELKSFIKALDDFEFCMKKTTNFLIDAQYIKSQAENLKRLDHGKNLSIAVFNVIKRVIRGLYCFVKYLELCFKIDEEYQYFYQEIDDVDNCELMRTDESEVLPNKFKEMFALFAYVQSYLLLRLGMIIATNLDEGIFILKKKIYDITNKVKHQTTLLPSFLLVQKEDSELQENLQKLIDSETNKKMPKEVVQIRSSTIEFTLKTLLLVLELKEFHEVVMKLSDKCQMEQENNLNCALKCLEDIGSRISTCTDEQSRLIILLKKYLNKEPEVTKIADMHMQQEETVSLKKIYCENDLPQQTDDFFYVDPQREEYDSEDKSCDEKESIGDLDEENLHVKQTKKCFKFVLWELKERVAPIDVDMKKREKKVLKEKGIEISEENNENIEKIHQSDEDDDLDDTKLEQKQNRYRNKYAENRDFLQTKNQINLFAPQNMIPVKNFITMQEEVLE